MHNIKKNLLKISAHSDSFSVYFRATIASAVICYSDKLCFSKVREVEET